MRGTQYAAAFRFYHRRLWNTGSPAFAGDDSGKCDALHATVIASEAKQSSFLSCCAMDCFVASLLAMTKS
jgi:hypothetical protein